MQRCLIIQSLTAWTSFYDMHILDPFTGKCGAAFTIDETALPCAGDSRHEKVNDP
jgi:hypothetical protein